MTPVNSSTSGYRNGIFDEQREHLPPRIQKLTMGNSSYHRNTERQSGQNDLLSNDIPFGSR